MKAGALLDRRLLHHAAGILVLLVAGTQAHAACTPVATGAPTPVPGTTVTCTGATIDQNASGVGYGTGNQTGVTINVTDGASLTGMGLGGIVVGDATVSSGVGASIAGRDFGIAANTGSLIVTNSGSVTGTNNSAIVAARDANVINRAGGTISGEMFSIYTNLGAITLDNAGTITSTSNAAVSAGSDVTATNHVGGVIRGTQAIEAFGGSAFVSNSGSIVGTGSGIVAQFAANVTNQAGGTITGGFVGVLTNVGAITLDNAGTITSTSNAAVRAGTDVTAANHAGGVIRGAEGIGALGGSAFVSNSGSIVGTSASGISARFAANVTNQAGGTIFGEIFGIFTDLGAITLENAGTITSTSNSAVIAETDVTATNRAGGVIRGARGIEAFRGSAFVTNSGTITGQDAGVWANGSAILINNAGASITGDTYGVWGRGGSSVWNAGTISGGTAAIRLLGTGNTITLAPGSSISGNVLGTGSDTFQLGGTGAASFDISQFGPAAQYRGFGTFNKIDSSLWSLTGTATYAGPVNVNGGTLAVNGNLASASMLTVNPDGTIGGNGRLGTTAINGGKLAPGNSIGTLTMSSLTMTAASTYLVEVSGTSSDRTVVTGSAAIAGKVSVNPLTRLGSTTTYTILNAGTLTGTFDSASVTGNFARNARLSYVGNSVLLTLDPGLLAPILPAGASVNQNNVAAGIDNALVSGASLPAGFNALFALSGNDLLNALTQVSGETATGAQQTTFDAMTQFMGVISDPFTASRGGTAPGAASFAAESDALADAPNGRKRSRAERDAYALLTKAPPQVYDPRWNVWAAGFGGSRTTDGDAVLGSGRTTSSIAGGAVGADYWFSPATVAGFALAGGGTSFSVAGGGSGRSDLFQAGAFIRHSVASSYVTATTAYGWQDISTDRLVTAAGTDRLRASFNANAYSGRIEAGHRWALPGFDGIGVTPYAAAQVTAFDLPAYAETSLNGSGFALNYAGKTVTATRSEFGLRGDTSSAIGNAILTVRGCAAWAHDYNTDRNVSATFQSLPGASFVVNGANAAADVALTSVSAELAFASGWSLAATFDGEFANTTRSYAGKGVMRYAW